VSAQSVHGGTGSVGDGAGDPQADPTSPGDAPGVSPAGRRRGIFSRGSGQGPGFSIRRLALTLLVAGVVVGLVRGFLVQTFVIPSGSMEPGLQVGDRVVVSRLDYRFGSVQRGDVVVFDGDGLFAPAQPESALLARAGQAVARVLGSPVGETDFVKRVIGVGGDHVICCDDQGRITVNGTAVQEDGYLFPGDEPSAQPFDVRVPAGHLWLMGDHRSASADSREHLGDPGSGMVPVGRVIGRVVAIWWPFDRATGVGRPDGAAAPAAGAPGGAGTTTAPRAVRPGQEGTP
jgi:signal peptidase I